MQTFLKIAWRNIWRNRTRTFLTAFVVFISVILTLVMTSQQYGMYAKMIENVVEISGNLQIQKKTYWENKSLNDAIAVDSTLLEKIKKTEQISGVTSHLESFALASYREMTKGVVVIGIVPSEEDGFSKLRKKLSKSANNSGNYLTDGEDGVLLGEKLATLLRIGIGDTVVLLSQGYHGTSAAGLFPVRGFFKLPSTEMESSLIYMTLTAAQNFYNAAGLCTSILIKSETPSVADHLQVKIESLLSPEDCIKNWQEIHPEIDQMIQSDISSGYFMKGIFYMIITFILFSTLGMMIHERRKECGILHAIGMQKSGLSGTIFIELLLITILGTFSGIAAGFLIIYLLNQNPIPLQGDMAIMMEEYGFEPTIFFSKSVDIFYWQPVIIFCLTLFLYLFPLITINRMKIIKALRS